MHSRMRAQTPKSCPLISWCKLRYTQVHEHIDIDLWPLCARASTPVYTYTVGGGEEAKEEEKMRRRKGIEKRRQRRRRKKRKPGKPCSDINPLWVCWVCPVADYAWVQDRLRVNRSRATSHLTVGRHSEDGFVLWSAKKPVRDN